MTEPLSDEEVNERLEELNIWGLVGDKLATEIEFNSYKEGCFFANTIFSLSEELSHHPKVTVEHGSVIVDITTHEAEGLTEKDFELAEKIEKNLGSVDWS
ncbi:MAG: 4a-hydroxytetrahydrobiopterin dehydratase [Candidatus Nanohaloarchaea archaeon]